MKFEKRFTMYIGDEKRRLLCKLTNTIHKYCFESKKDMNLIKDVSVSPYSYSVLCKLKVKQCSVKHLIQKFVQHWAFICDSQENALQEHYLFRNITN